MISAAGEGLLLASITAGLAAASVGWWVGRSAAAAAAVAAQAALQHEQEKRAADRAGRIRAEQKLRDVKLQLAQLTATAAQQQPGGSGGSSSSQQVPVYPFTPIGVLRSCFDDRRGTPRQPHLVSAARAALKLGPGIPAACLRGLDGFSHCWVVYVFHANTDLAKLLASRAAAATTSSGDGAAAGSSGRGSSSSSNSSQVKALVSVPRLNGGKMGVLATRSPHRPVPIGLSTARIVSVDAEAGVLVLGGTDIVDGSPVLDVKPYVPFSDALPDATAPAWVTAAAADDEEPLLMGGVSFGPGAVEAIAAAWAARGRESLYSSGQELVELVQQVLSRDIRSLHQRQRVAPVAVQGQQQQQECGTVRPEPTEGLQQHPNSQQTQQQQYIVRLDGVEVTYTIDRDSGHVLVLGASVACQ